MTSRTVPPKRSPSCKSNSNAFAAKKQRGSGGRARLELRLEVFNLFNRANFANPTLNAFAGASANEASCRR